MRKPSEIIQLTMDAGLYNEVNQYMCWSIEKLPGITPEEIELTQKTIVDTISPFNTVSGHLWLRDVHSVAPTNRFEALVEWYLEFITELKEKEGL